VQQKGTLFDHLVGVGDQTRWSRETERLGCLEIDRQCPDLVCSPVNSWTAIPPPPAMTQGWWGWQGVGTPTLMTAGCIGPEAAVDVLKDALSYWSQWSRILRIFQNVHWNGKGISLFWRPVL